MKKLLWGLALAGVCGSVCADEATGFEDIPWFLTVAQGHYMYSTADEGGTEWRGRRVRVNGVDKLQFYTRSENEPGVYWVMTSFTKGHGDRIKSTVLRVETEVCEYRRKDTMMIYFDDYLGKGNVNFQRGGVKALRGDWYPVREDDILYGGVLLDCHEKLKEMGVLK